MKVLVCTNVLNQIHNFAYMSHCNLWHKMAKDFPNTEFISFFPYRMSIDMARNTAARIALENKCDYLMFVDDDMYVHPNTFNSLYSAGKDICMAHCFIRGVPFHPMFFKSIGENAITYYDDYEKDIDPDTGLVDCAAVGFATVLIKMDLIRKMHPPYFVTGSGMTEDVYFCLKAREFEPSIAVDCKVGAGHILNPEIVDINTVGKLRDFYGAKLHNSMVIDSDAEDIARVMEELKNA